MSRQLKLFLSGVLLLGITSGIFETTFNNFLHETFSLNAEARGRLEFPRELPGFLTALFAGLLFFLPETAVATVAAVAVGLGMLGIANFGMHWMPMLVFMTLWSAGVHLTMSVHASISMDLAGDGGRGRRLGQVRGVGVAATLVGCAIVLACMKWMGHGYRIVMSIGGIMALLAAWVLSRMQMPGAHLRRPRFVFEKSYGLYYWLCLLHGARKQIFITFGPWVLIQEFGQRPEIFAILWSVSAVVGMWFQPFAGRLIDRFGERRILMAEGFSLLLVCSGYAFSNYVPLRTAALYLLYLCYVGDQLLFGLSMARTTYLSKIALKPEHVSPSISLGQSIDHIVSMTLPWVGGAVWMRYSYPVVFAGAGMIAIVMIASSMWVRATPRPVVVVV